MFYNFLNDKSLFVKTNSLLAWESYLGTSYTNEQWHKALRHTHSATKCTNLWELSYKVMQRWYLTPYRIAKFDSSTPSLCWRNCSQTGTIFHILWSCGRLAKFWSIILSIFHQVTGLHTQPSPSLAILNLGIEEIPPSLRKFTTHLFPAAKLVILRLWRATDPPEVKEVIRTFSIHHTYESMLANIEGKYADFHLQWQPWIEWYKA